MKILVLAPHPFYQERGTPIAVNLMLRVWAERGDTVTLLTYHEGEPVQHPGLTHHRIARPPFATGIRPGFSLGKLLSDLWMFPRALSLSRRVRPDLVHAVEESVFMARWIRRLHGVPYVYDMDSSLSQQMGETSAFFRWIAPLLRAVERGAVRRALRVLAVCPALVEVARTLGARRADLLPDISLLDLHAGADPDVLADCPLDGFRFMYIGNLEAYQGIDLLLSAFERAAREEASLRLVLVGGRPHDVKAIQQQIATAGLADRAWCAGPRPVRDLAAMMAQADALVSPRLKGVNTPMKIYSYLDSGKPVLATRLPTHTQVLDEEIALLADPRPDAFAAAMVRLARDAELRERVGAAGRAYARCHHSLASFQQRFSGIVTELEAELREHRENCGTRAFR